MINYENLEEYMLTDKHIDQYAGYLLEDLPNGVELLADIGLSHVLITMYKKGFEDACYNMGLFNVY